MDSSGSLFQSFSCRTHTFCNRFRCFDLVFFILVILSQSVNDPPPIMCCSVNKFGYAVGSAIAETLTPLTALAAIDWRHSLQTCRKIKSVVRLEDRYDLAMARASRENLLLCDDKICRGNYLEADGWAAIIEVLGCNKALTSLNGFDGFGEVLAGRMRELNLIHCFGESLADSIRPTTLCSKLFEAFAPLLVRSATSLTALNVRCALLACCPGVHSLETRYA